MTDLSETNFVFLGYSQSGKDALARCLPNHTVLQFKQPMTKLLDLIYGGDYEETKHDPLPTQVSRTKYTLMLDLWHFWQARDPECTVRIMRRVLDSVGKPWVVTDCRKLPEAELLKQFNPTVVYMPGGTYRESDCHLRDTLRVFGPYYTWEKPHPASLSPSECQNHLKELIHERSART